MLNRQIFTLLIVIETPFAALKRLNKPEYLLFLNQENLLGFPPPLPFRLASLGHHILKFASLEYKAVPRRAPVSA